MRYNLRSLQVFEAVSRHLSVSDAAVELGITQSAVSHQLRKLGEELGERLVSKAGRRIILTDAGKQLSGRLQSAFLEIDRSVSEAVGVNRTTVRLAVCTSFAPGWLIGKLRDFYEDFPNIDLQLQMYAKDPELTDSVADAFVTTLPKEPGFWSLRLETELLVPVFAASLAPFKPGSVPLITTDLEPDSIGDDWQKYCALAGVTLDELNAAPWLQVSHYVLALEMARAGLGMALVPDFLARQDIANGKLAQLGSRSMPTNEDYFLCIKTSRRNEQPLLALEKWIRSELKTEHAKVSKLFA